MKPGSLKDAVSVRAGRSRNPGDPGLAGAGSAPGKDADEDHPASGQPVTGMNAGRHVYRVGGLRIPVKDSVRGTGSRCAGRVRDLLKRRAEAPVAGRCDPTAIEPPIRKPPAPRDRPASHDLSSPPHNLHPGRGKAGVDDGEEDLGDED
jgi:hypothetical protein